MTPCLLNADVGEGCDDALIMPFIDCANIACGAHAGDSETMRQTLALAKEHRIKAGAHPGYPDRANFGRKSLDMDANAIEATVSAQIAALGAIASTLAYPLAYVKPHGALNHDMLQSDAIFHAICRAVVAENPNLALMVPTNTRHQAQQAIAGQYKLTVWWEVFADRAYEANGLLRSRQYDDALHATPERIMAQLDGIIRHGRITAVDGTSLDVSNACTICIHGDHPASVAAIRQWQR